MEDDLVLESEVPQSASSARHACPARLTSLKTRKYPSSRRTLVTLRHDPSLLVPFGPVATPLLSLSLDLEFDLPLASSMP